MENKSNLYIIRDEKVSGPYSLDELASWVSEGRASPALEVCPEGSNEWQSLGEYAPGKIASAAGEAILNQKKAAKKTRTGIAIASCAVLLVLIWSLVVWSQARRIQHDLASAVNDLAETSTQLEDKESKAQMAAREAGALGLRLQESVRQAKNALDSATDLESRKVELEQMLRAKELELETKLTEIETKTERIQALELMSISYADKLASAYRFMQKTADLPNRVVVTVDASRGLLSVDSDSIKTLIESAFVNNGFTIAQAEESILGALKLYVSVNQVSTNDRASAYSARMICYSICGRGNNVKAYNAFEEFLLGYAGVDSDYRDAIREFITVETANCIAALKDLRDESAESSLPSPEKVYDDLIAEEVPLQPRGIGKQTEPNSSGSGVLIASRPLILTNHHVVDDAARLLIYLPNRPQGVEAVLLFSDKSLDLAVLGAKERIRDFEGAAFPPLAEDDELSTGGEVFSLGYPLVTILGKEVKYSSGSISSLTGMRGAASEFQLSVPTQPGNSGGPVFLKSGSMCGVMVSMLSPMQALKSGGALPQNVNYAIHPKAIRSFLIANGLLSEVQSEKHEKVDIAKAKEFTVLIEAFNE